MEIIVNTKTIVGIFHAMVMGHVFPSLMGLCVSVMNFSTVKDATKYIHAQMNHA